MLTVLRIFVSYSAVYVVFCGLVYFIGCIIIVVLSPKICKALFAGSSAIGSLVGGALTAVAAGAIGATGFAGATGMLGSGGLGKAASSISGISSPAGSSPGPDPTAGPLGQSKSVGVKSPGAEEAAIATGLSKKESPRRGVVSQSTPEPTQKGGSSPGPQPAGTIPDVNNQPMNVSSAPQPASTPGQGANVTPQLRTAPATSSKGSRILNIAKGAAHVARHTAMAAASGGSLGGYVQSHMSFLDKKKGISPDSHADDGVPDAKS
jgi:hypothetical protein